MRHDVMTALIWWTVLAAYCAMVLATWCAGAFGIGASANDDWERSQRGPLLTREEDFVLLRLRSWVVAILGGCIWPVAVPLYLAYRKGVYVDDALTKRNALLAKDGQR